MLQLEGITKVFGGLTALEGVSLTAGKRTITGIIGPNGAGKTTLFNIATGIYSRTSGRIILEGKYISGSAPEELAGLGMVRTFQNVELFGQMTVLENVMVGLHSMTRSGILACAFKLPGHIREERHIREMGLKWLEFTGMAGLRNVRASNLPFGRGRLLEIARALAVEPKIILMDEPAAGLNSRETLGLADLIRRIKDLGKTFVARGDIGKHQRRPVAGAVAGAYLECLEAFGGEERGLETLNGCSRRTLVLQAHEECPQQCRCAFDFDEHALRRVGHPAGQAQLRGKAVHKGAKADALHGAADGDFKPVVSRRPSGCGGIL